MKKPPDRNHGDWLKAATRRLASGGIAAVAVETLARDLAVTKGSFYWHFRDRAALLKALLADWEAGSTAPLLRRLDAAGEGPGHALATWRPPWQPREPGASTRPSAPGPCMTRRRPRRSAGSIRRASPSSPASSGPWASPRPKPGPGPALLSASPRRARPRLRSARAPGAPSRGRPGAGAARRRGWCLTVTQSAYILLCEDAI